MKKKGVKSTTAVDFLMSTHLQSSSSGVATTSRTNNASSRTSSNPFSSPDIEHFPSVQECFESQRNNGGSDALVLEPVPMNVSISEKVTRVTDDFSSLHSVDASGSHTPLRSPQSNDHIVSPIGTDQRFAGASGVSPQYQATPMRPPLHPNVSPIHADAFTPPHNMDRRSLQMYSPHISARPDSSERRRESEERRSDCMESHHEDPTLRSAQQAEHRDEDATWLKTDTSGGHGAHATGVSDPTATATFHSRAADGEANAGTQTEPVDRRYRQKDDVGSAGLEQQLYPVFLDFVRCVREVSNPNVGQRSCCSCCCHCCHAHENHHKIQRHSSRHHHHHPNDNSEHHHGIAGPSNARHIPTERRRGDYVSATACRDAEALIYEHDYSPPGAFSYYSPTLPRASPYTPRTVPKPFDFVGVAAAYRRRKLEVGDVPVGSSPTPHVWRKLSSGSYRNSPSPIRRRLYGVSSAPLRSFEDIILEQYRAPPIV